MKVLVVSGAFPPVQLAEANHALHLAEALAACGAEVQVLTTLGALADGFPFQVHPIMRDWGWRDIPRFVGLLRRETPDAILMVYIGFAYNEHPMPTFLPTIAKAVLPGVVFASQFEGVMGARAERLGLGSRVCRKLVSLWAGVKGLDWEFGSLLRDSDRVITLASQHGHHLAERLPAVRERLELIPPPPIIKVSQSTNGTARRAGRARLGFDAAEFVLTYFGYLYPEKGVETLLRALAEVKQGGRRVRLVIAGGIPSHLQAERAAYLRELEALTLRLGVGEWVTWTGFLSWESEEPSLYLSAADVCVLPFHDGVRLNNSTVAAAAVHRLPILSTRGSSLDAVFRHGENVFLCPPNDPGALARAIETLYDRPELRKSLAAGAEALANAHFSWQTTGPRLLNLLSEAR